MPKISKYWAFLGGIAENLKMFWLKMPKISKCYAALLFTILLFYYFTIFLRYLNFFLYFYAKI